MPDSWTPKPSPPQDSPRPPHRDHVARARSASPPCASRAPRPRRPPRRASGPSWSARRGRAGRGCPRSRTAACPPAIPARWRCPAIQTRIEFGSPALPNPPFQEHAINSPHPTTAFNHQGRPTSLPEPVANPQTRKIKPLRHAKSKDAIFPALRAKVGLSECFSSRQPG